MAFDKPSKADLRFDIMCPKGMRVKIRPPDQTAPWLVQMPHLRDQLDLLDPKTAYAVEMVYEVHSDVIMVRLFTHNNRWFNAFLFEAAP